MKNTITLAIVTLLWVSGCGRKPSTPEPAPPAPGKGGSLESMVGASATPSAAPAAQGAPAAVAAESAPPAAAPEAKPVDPKNNPEGEFDGSTEYTDLSKYLQIFAHQKSRMPNDIGELLRFAGMAPPRLPVGYRLAMDKESKTVRIVKPAGK